MSAERWTTAQDARLARLWIDEGLGATKCAEQLGKSKNAIIGRVGRLQLPKHPPKPGLVPGFKPHRPSPPPAETRTEPEQLPPVAPLPDDASSRPAAFSRCQWITNSARPWRFCDQPKWRGAWCEVHHRIVYVGNPRRDWAA